MAAVVEPDLSQQDAKIQLMAPDGYYTYLGVEKRLVEVADATTSNNPVQPQRTAFTVDVDAVNKNYRKLSRKHHPDKGGDQDTFRLLKRAQKVLTNPKLRAQYDNLGIDLDEDHEGNQDDDNNANADTGISQGIVSELASLALTSIIQLAIRTMLMGAVAVIIVRFRLTLYPSLLFMGYAVFSVVGKASVRGGSVYDTGGVELTDALSPALIIVGLWLMSMGAFSVAAAQSGDEQPVRTWSWLFWVGESMVISLFSYNSITSVPWNLLTLGTLSIAGALLALWFRGSFYNYLIVVVVECIFAVLVALAFPIMELLLEAILNEKLKKVGEKVRDHHREVERYYQTKMEARQSK
mmetsp:Transcript_6630/g.14744  ORF Transcript_6630/g.14744 Transcript_6630/m.14744 type:complete len:352 (-) Transcript_6630:14-1069(-)